MDKDKLWLRGFVAFALWIVIILIISLLILSIYQVATGHGAPGGSLLHDPQIISIAIGLLVSVLFVERWRSLETKVDLLSTAQRESLDRLEKSVDADFKRRLSQSIGKAETLSAKISEILELHPWLEVITERDIFVETDSVRGIIRSCYSLLKDEKYGHLFEYLEYHSKKGTSSDPREISKRSKLRGAPDDFLELANFCETWLEDYYLSSQFLARFSETSGAQGAILIPSYLRRLIRLGDYAGAKHVSKHIIYRLYGDTPWLRLAVYLGWPRPLPERTRWEAVEVLSLFEAVSGDTVKAKRIREKVASKLATMFPIEQSLRDCEFAQAVGEWERARAILVSIEDQLTSIHHLRDAAYLAAQLGEVKSALWFRERMTVLRAEVFGDSEPNAPNDESESGAPVDAAEGERARGPARSPMWEKEMSERALQRGSYAKDNADKSR
jgi:hypothetical protein